MKSLRIRLSKIIWRLIAIDTMFWAGWGFVNPIFSIFVIQRIEGGTIAVVGAAVAIYWTIRALARIPISLFLDSFNGEEDDFWFLFFGSGLMSFVFFGYLMASRPWHVYCLQVVFALGLVIHESGLSAIFTRHIDLGKEATEWGVYSTLADLGIAVSGGLAGLLVSSFGFEITFIFGGLLLILTTILAFFSLKIILPNNSHRRSLLRLKSSLKGERR